LEGAAVAACETHLPIEIHTEKGALAEKAFQYFSDRGVLSNQIVLCHMDKRPDAELHKDLASQGVLLEYDTFYRPKYEPEKNLWPLIDKMVDAGFAGNIVLATDMAEASSYYFIENGPGLASLPGKIHAKLIDRGIPETAIRQMIGENISCCLAGIE
jgi:phosphotriesterase-related protein